MAIYNKYQKAIEVMLEAGNCGSDVFKLVLSNTAPTAATDTTVVGEIAAGNGYTTGGATVTTVSALQTAGTYKLICSVPSPTWTSVTGNMATFQYAILYNTTQSQCMCWWDYGTAIVLNGLNGDTFTVTLDSVSGVFTVA